MIDFPSAPWKLGGWGIGTISLVDAHATAATVPAGVSVVSLVRGKTVGGLVYLSYRSGSLVYQELNVVAGLVRVGSRMAFWIPRLYVDSQPALDGGREIWGVSKELAEFSLVHNIGMTTIEVRQGAQVICRMRCSVPTRRLRIPLPLPAFGVREDEFLFFAPRLDARLALARATVDMPEGSEFASLGLDRPRIAVRLEDLNLDVPAPELVPRNARARETEFAPAESEATEREPSYGTS